MKMFKAGIKLKGEYKLVVGNSNFEVYDENENKIYYENSSGYWHRTEYDKNVNRTYFEDSDGYWYKKKYDENGNELYFENSNRRWSRTEYDENGNRIYYEKSNGYWSIIEYDKNGNRIYYEDSSGFAVDYRPKKELTVEEIEKKLGYKIKIIGGENNVRLK